MFEPRSSDRANDKVLDLEKRTPTSSHGSYDMARQAKKFVQRYCELATRTSLCIDHHQSKREALQKTVGALSNECSHTAPKCFYLARIGRSDFLWSVNKLARNGREPCDRHLARSISYIHNTSALKQHCHVGNTAEQCRLGLFDDTHTVKTRVYVDIRRNLMHFRRSNICSKKVDVQEAIGSLTHFNRVRGRIFGRWHTHERDPRSGLL